jgi:GNAT superfamily N-acetyltransferase
LIDPEARLERLGPHHAFGDFERSQADLDTWLKQHALAAQEMGSARTFVLVRAGQLIGYFSLTMGSVRRVDAPAKLVRGLPSYPVGMVLLARLAVDRGAQGQGWGGQLLAEALRKAVAAGEAVTARLVVVVVVDAVDERSTQFYLRHGFVAAPEHPSRLYRRTKDIRASMEGPGGT